MASNSMIRGGIELVNRKRLGWVAAIAGLALSFSSTTFAVSAGGTYGIVKSYSTRYSTIELDVGHFKIDRKELFAKRAKLKSGAVVEFNLSPGGKGAAEGVISSIRVFQNAKDVCDVECL